MPPAGQQQEEDVGRGSMGAGFEGAQGLMNQEVKYVLDRIASTRKDQISNWQPSKVVLDAQEYVNKLPWASNPNVINNMRGLMADRDMSSIEVALVGNLLPDSVEECRALVPSTDNEQRFSDQELQDVLTQLIKYQNLPGQSTQPG